MIDVIFLFRHRCGSDLASTAALPAPFWKTPVLELFGPPMKKSRGELCHPQPRRGGQLGVEAGDPQLRTSQMSAQDKTSSESTVESKMQGLHSGINRNTGLCVCVCEIFPPTCTAPRFTGSSPPLPVPTSLGPGGPQNPPKLS